MKIQKKYSKNHTPLVSVIMPVYNAGEFLRDAIESIMAQSFTDFEFIIVDDASTDYSWEIIKWFRDQYPAKIKAIRLIKNRNNGGDACANVGFAVARGKFIARMDADDIAHPKRLAKQVDYMQKHQDVILLGTQAFVIDRNGAITGEKLEPKTHKKISENYFIYHPMIHPSVMIRRSLLPKRNYLYNIKYNANNDLLTFFELLKYGKFANLGDKLLYYRIHGANDSLVDPKRKFANTFKIRMQAWRELGYKPTPVAVALTFIQLLISSTMPEKVITFLYMTWRGLSKPQSVLKAPRFATAYS